MGKRHLHAEEEDHLGEGERDHGEVDSLAPDRQRTRDCAEGGSAGDTGQQAEFGCEIPGLHDMAVAIACNAEEHCMAEAHQAGIAQQQIEGAGEQRKAERRHQEYRIGKPGRGQGQDGDEGGHDQPLTRGHHLVCPNRPAGLTSRTIAMTTKITVLEAGG